ncbi:MAG: metal-dependent protease of the PAD1/JAB1 superfamily, partial [Acutalibacteraceae bacterium]|nr:metal-dependent protease of the PAD1/JAB1 superfamily [Acutalibacteraceae bacterium]
MAKKKNTKDKRDQINNLVEERELPKNILPFGQRVEENKNIYISQKIYKEIHKFTQNKTTNESGGMLIGYVIDEFEKTNIVINGFIEAKYCEATPTTLTFTHETWDYVHSEMEKKYPESKIVGWIHT